MDSSEVLTNLFFNTSLASTLDINLFCSAYIFIDQYPDALSLFIETSRNVFDDDGEAYFDFPYLDQTVLVVNNEWNRFSMTHNNQLSKLYIHINGTNVATLNTSNTLFPQIINEFMVESWVERNGSANEIRVSKIRYIEYPVYNENNYQVRSLLRSPYPLN